MVSAAASSAASAQLFRQAEGLKANISGKFAETNDHFSEEYVTCKNLKDIYKTILLSDLQYALDRKVELELWNSAFKGPIDYLRQRVKEKKGSDKAELQAKLCFFIDGSMGFYLQLLHEFCDRNDIESPFRKKAIHLGILTEYNTEKREKPKASSCYYVCQDCLVHLGDLARYRNDINRAESYYNMASKVVAANGQPYNQLAIIASSKGDQLKAVFYYCKSVLVQNPFPAAVSNLQKTFNQFCSRQSLSILAKTNSTSVEEFISLFLQYHGSVYLMHNVDKLSAIQERILSDFNVIHEDLSTNQLLHMTVLNIFTVYKNKPKEEEEQDECLADDEIEVWNLVVDFTFSLYGCLVTLAVSQYEAEDEAKVERFLPSIKVFSDFVLCQGSSILMEKTLDKNKEFYRKLSVLGNELLKRSSPISTPTATPLPEDHETNGFFPLRRLHRKLDFKQKETSDERIKSLRAYRVISFINWFCQQEPASRYICKGECEGEARFICLQPEAEKDEASAAEDCRMSDKDFDIALSKLFDTLPELQVKGRPARSKSPFRETRSLFRTDSEEQGIKEVPQVSGPVASYSLFDSTWSVPFSRSPTKDLAQDEQGYSEIFEKLLISVCKGNITQAQSPAEPTTTQADLFPKAPRSLNLGVFPSSASVSRPQPRQPQRAQIPPPSSPMASQIPNHPVQQQLSRLPQAASPQLPRTQQPSPSFFANHHSLPMQQNRMPLPTQIDTSIKISDMKPATFTNPVSPVGINQQPLPFANQPQPLSYPMSTNVLAQTSNFPGFAPTLVRNGAVFGAIGQTPRSQYQSSGPVNMTPPGSPAMNRNANKSNQSIWSSNYGFGQGALSPLEQLLKDQKSTQRYPMQPK